LNEEGSLIRDGWNGGDKEKLWRYNQHYFDDLNAINASERLNWHKNLMRRWVFENKPGFGVGWEPYPTSLRIVNWIKWALSGNELSSESLNSLFTQACWLSKRLEKHLLGNHLLSNAKALIFAGLFFKGVQADSWLKTGLEVLKREIPEQILDDGGHFELSTMYHALVLEDMLDLWNITHVYDAAFNSIETTQISEWSEQINRMICWLQKMCHPDGEISFFNDAAIGISASVVELNAYASRLNFNSQLMSFESEDNPPIKADFLSSSKYIRIEAPGLVAILDVAPIGPDYLTGHSHADTLTFELSIFDHRVIVNSGTSCYGVSEERLRQRGTSAHNTVVVNNKNSSEVWSSFRVGDRAFPINFEYKALKKEVLQVRCSHDGYMSLKDKPVHQRKWVISSGALTIKDWVFPAIEKSEARFHIHPEVELTYYDDLKSGELALPNNKKIFWQSKFCRPRIESTTYHPAFGIVQYTSCIVLDLNRGISEFKLKWK
jgi:uncharacterized heparinase superfamily protein